MARTNCRVIFFFAISQHAHKVTQQLSQSNFYQLKSDRPTITDSCKHQLKVKFQVPHCCISYSRYTLCSLTVSSARQVTACPLDSTQNSTSLWGQLHRPGALLTHSCPEAAIAHYWLLSGLTTPSMPPVCMVGLCVGKPPLWAERDVVMIR